MYEHSKRSIYPCQSTGLWFARDCVACRAFFDGLYGYLEERPNEWEQKAFQLMVMRYLVGLGDELPPLRYRLLPTSRYVNIEFYEERVRMRRAGARLFHSSLSRGFNAWLSCADPLDGTRAHFKTSHLRTRNAGTSTSRRGSRRCFAARKRD